MQALLLGQNGQLAREVQAQAPELGVSLIVLGREAVDLSQTDQVERILPPLLTGVDVVINASAYTAVDQAEEHLDDAMRLNGAAVAQLARLAKVAAVPIVHVSTDYVFDGSGTAPWAPADATAPINAYGQSKLAGEEAIRAEGGAHAIVRTSWVFSEYGQNFVKTMLRLAKAHPSLRVVGDQIGGPTPASALAHAVLTAAYRLAADPAVSGTYHFSGAPYVSWAEFARQIFEQAGTGTEVVEIPTRDYPTPAERPLNSRLDGRLFEETFGLKSADWKRALEKVLRRLD